MLGQARHWCTRSRGTERSGGVFSLHSPVGPSGCMEPVSTPAFTLVRKCWALPQSQGTTGPLVCL